ncbi:MAG: metallophosphoesterase [Turicibacter sp.]|nr:metallophosphoesterase [Turicibacter sp.]
MRILATTDVHGHPLPQKIGKADILIDAGDFFIGSPLTTFYNTTMEISPLVKTANDIGYDVMIPGNHDFDHGLDFLLRQAKELKAAYVCANITDLQGNPIFEPYTIIKRKKMKVGIIGLMTSLLPTLLPYEISKGFKCLDAQEALQSYLPELRKTCDLVIAVYHGGLESDLLTGAPTQYHTGEDEAYKLAGNSQLDGLICGHQHRVNAGAVGSCLLVQPGSKGQFAGELRYGKKKRQAKIRLLKAESEPNPEFDDWIKKPIDLSRFPEYLKTITPAISVMSFKGNTIQDFMDSFQAPYNILEYRLSDEEIEGIVELPPNPEGHHIVTNQKTFPPYRLQKQYVTNIFDEYLKYITPKR